MEDSSGRFIRETRVRARSAGQASTRAFDHARAVPRRREKYLISYAGAMTFLPSWLSCVLLLVASNTFMTFAWYYHLRHKGWSLLLAIAISWLIALPEYILQVPANRVGHVSTGGPFTLPQLKIIQEAITMTVFAVFTIVVMGEKFRGTDIAAFVLVFAGVSVAMLGRHWDSGAIVR
jgi:uncharacterized protein (DUF486 family)